MWGEAQDQYQQVYENDQPHEGKLSHEVIAGAGAFAAFKVFEDRQRSEGQQVNHAFAKEMLAGIAGAEVDKLAETKGEDFFDKERSKHEAKKRAEKMYDDHYGDQDSYDPQNQPPPQALQDQFGSDRW